MEAVERKIWRKVFAGVVVLVAAQIAWWMLVFVQNTNQNAELRLQIAENTPGLTSAALAEERQKILRESFHRKVMFLSESTFFLCLVGWALYLLFRALRLEQLSRQTQRNFIEIVTHESKTPLTALKLRLESISPSPDIALALDEVRRLSSILEKALSLNRLERHAFVFESLDLADLVRTSIRRLEPVASARAIRVELKSDGEARVQGDNYGLQAVMQSLIENAILYHSGGDGARVEVRVLSRPEKVIVQVEDNGPGIPETEWPKIFDRFYRVRGAQSSKVPGTGLGLYIAKTVVEAHRGKLGLKKSTLGSLFEIELPAEK